MSRICYYSYTEPVLRARPVLQSVGTPLVCTLARALCGFFDDPLSPLGAPITVLRASSPLCPKMKHAILGALSRAPLMKIINVR